MRKLIGHRVHVAIFRGDVKGKILQTMAMGRQASIENEQKAVEYAQEFVEMADTVPGKFATYGAVIVQCQATGNLITCLPLRKGAVPNEPVTVKATEKV